MAVPALTYTELVERSAALPYAFPTQANRLACFADRAAQLETQAAQVRPILHTDSAALIEECLAALREVGTPRERALYADMSPAAFVSRLLARRPLAFLTSSDSYLLRDGRHGTGGFEEIGTELEGAGPLRLAELISYDEMAISALLGVAVPTPFINAGGRRNMGRPGPAGEFVERGVYVGLVGARFERRERMEWQQLLVTPEQNTRDKGYGAEADPDARATRLRRCWARCLGRQWLPTYAEAAADHSGRYLEVPGCGLLDVELYRRRMRLSIEPFLREADARAAAAGQAAYVHAVGLGLGVWRIHPLQQALMVEVYAACLRELALPHIADLDFSWFRETQACAGVRDGELFETQTRPVRVHFSCRDPAARLPDADKLVIAMYAWDANAFPGNEYWLGSLSASGDPAAACCSLIPELQNPDVNPRVAGEFARCYGSSAGASQFQSLAQSSSSSR